jgi:para-nitrobenzyl esterase
VVLKTPIGQLRGRLEGDSVAFLGIPYVQPTTAARRFTAPELVLHLSTLLEHSKARSRMYTADDGSSIVYDATHFGARCPQGDSAFGGSTHMDEDCLFLNIWVPRNLMREDDAGQYYMRTDSLAPVMVFIHGGAFVLGSGADAYVDGAAYNRRSVILVSMNYRLGALGFLAHPALSEQVCSTQYQYQYHR